MDVNTSNKTNHLKLVRKDVAKAVPHRYQIAESGSVVPVAVAEEWQRLA